MSSDLYEGSSIRGLCHEAQRWGSHIPSGSERDKRRKLIEQTIRSVVALPERLNTENCIDLIYCSHRMVPLVSSASWGEYLFVFNVASSQLRTSLATETSVRRWLEYHDGGVGLIQTEIMNLLGLIRDVQNVLPAVNAALSRALAATIIANLLPLTHRWQSAEQIEGMWLSCNGLFPPVGGLMYYISCLLDDCSAAARYLKRGVFQSKTDQEDEYVAISLLRLALTKCLASFVAVPCRGPDVSQCISRLENVIWEPHYKSRDLILVSYAIRSIAIITAAGSDERIADTLLLTVSESLLDSNNFDVEWAQKAAKERWVQARNGPENFPIWAPSAISELLALSTSALRSSPGVAIKFLVALVSVLPKHNLGSIFSQFILLNQPAVSVVLSSEATAVFFLSCVRCCVHDALRLAPATCLESLAAIIAQQCKIMQSGARYFKIELLREELTPLASAITRECDGVVLLLLLRVWTRELQLSFLTNAASQAEGTTFSAIATSMQDIGDLLLVVRTKLSSSVVDNEVTFLRQENAVIATSLWRSMPNETANPSLLSAINDLIALF